MMLERILLSFAETQQINFYEPSLEAFYGNKNKAVKAHKVYRSAYFPLDGELLSVMRTKNVSTIQQIVEPETEVKEKKKKVTKTFMKALILT